MAYYPILGNALDISDFGGSEVFYNWMKGAPPDVSNHLFNLFLIDKTAKYFITDEKWIEKDMHGRNISHRGSITGKNSLCSSSSTMKINLYSR